jgi:hypothetical protein
MMNELEELQKNPNDASGSPPIVPGKTAANASIFQPLLKKETSVFEQIVM